MNNEQHPIYIYQSTTNEDHETRNANRHLEPNHTHFLFFDDESNDIEVFVKRPEIEHELSISKALRSPVVGYIPKSTSMCSKE